jgi:hypothetical protein
MTRAEATIALIAGKKIERISANDIVAPMRFDSVHGVQVGNIRATPGHMQWNAETPEGLSFVGYREAFTPREFLGKWIEVRTFDEAEDAGVGAEGRILRMHCTTYRESRFLEARPATKEQNGRWVARKAGV